MKFNNSSIFSNRQEYCTSIRVRVDNGILAATQNTDNKVYSKIPYSERSNKLPKGFKGLSQKEKERIDLAVYTLIHKYGTNNCKWFTFTFDEYCKDEYTSDEALINLASNYEKLINSIQYQLNNRIYKHCDIKPYLIVTGLRERTCYARKVICFDINVICVVKDKEGKELFNEDNFINDVYASASRNAKELIKRPLDFSSRVLDDRCNHKQLANYLKYQQVDENLLVYFQNSIYASLIPKSYVYIHSSLKNTFKDIVEKYPNSTAFEHKELMLNECDDVHLHESSG